MLKSLLTEWKGGMRILREEAIEGGGRRGEMKGYKKQHRKQRKGRKGREALVRLGSQEKSGLLRLEI